MKENNKKENILKKYKDSILRTIYVFLILGITIFGISFAWYSFTNPNIDVSGVTSNWCSGLDVTASGGVITNANLGSPVAAYNTGNREPSTDFTITNNETRGVKVDISLIDISMDSALKSEYFMYTLTDGTNVVSEGNFSNVNLGNGASIYIKKNLTLSGSSSKTYYLYLWIKDNGGDQNDMQNKTFSGKIKINISSNFCNAYNENNDIDIESLYYNITEDAVLDNIRSTYVNSDTGIKFNQISSDTNGKGIYIRAGTENDTHPIYYYRGAVDNNNVLFANFCWKIVRTTDTGGIKLIYNGTPTDGKCTNTTGDSTQIGTSKFNSPYDSLTDIGYMYGARYTYSSGTGTGWYYGNDVSWNGTSYTLIADSTNTYPPAVKSTISGTNLNYYHYTCGSSTELNCSSVRYVYYVSDSTAYYITLSNGKKVEDALSEMLDYNTTASTIKTAVDSWYSNNMTSYTENYLEDTIYCNDRSISELNGWNPSGGSTTSYLIFGAYIRNSNPIVTCPRDIDKFTVSSGIGNGKLSYPVGLLTEDEVRLAGGTNAINDSYYLYTNKTYWLSTPYAFGNYAYQYRVYSNGTLNYGIIGVSYGVRPVVSLKPNVKLKSGDGTANNPYTLS